MRYCDTCCWSNSALLCNTVIPAAGLTQPSYAILWYLFPGLFMPLWSVHQPVSFTGKGLCVYLQTQRLSETVLSCPVWEITATDIGWTAVQGQACGPRRRGKLHWTDQHFVCRAVPDCLHVPFTNTDFIRVFWPFLPGHQHIRIQGTVHWPDKAFLLWSAICFPRLPRKLQEGYEMPQNVKYWVNRETLSWNCRSDFAASGPAAPPSVQTLHLLLPFISWQRTVWVWHATRPGGVRPEGNSEAGEVLPGSNECPAAGWPKICMDCEACAFNSGCEFTGLSLKVSDLAVGSHWGRIYLMGVFSRWMKPVWCPLSTV